MPQKPHHNIFFYYRGPSVVDRLAERQLENNTTKALINVLEHGGTDLRLAFLNGVEPQLARTEFADARLALQSDPGVVSQVPRRYVVAITPENVREEGHPAIEPATGLPDALIYIPGKLGIVIESKLTAPLDDAQLSRHANTAGWATGTYELRKISWVQVFEWLRDTSASGIPKFLRDQFLEYLTLIGVAPFTGFRAEDFDHVAGDDPEYRALLRGKLEQFGARVYDVLPQEMKDAYPAAAHVGKITAQERGAWIGFRRDRSQKGAFRNCNCTVEISESGLTFNTVVRDGTASDRRSAIGVLCQRLAEHPDWFRAFFAALGPEYFLRVFRRTNAAGEDRILPGAERWHLMHTQRLSVVLPESLAHFEALLRAIPYPGVHVGGEISRRQVRLMTADELTSAAATYLSRLHPFLGSVEHGVV